MECSASWLKADDGIIKREKKNVFKISIKMEKKQKPNYFFVLLEEKTEKDPMKTRV